MLRPGLPRDLHLPAGLPSTIIHGISVPVAITGTFFFLYLLGFSINLLTLFALVLAIGIVVDDAVVVVEAVHAKLESGYKSPKGGHRCHERDLGRHRVHHPRDGIGIRAGVFCIRLLRRLLPAVRHHPRRRYLHFLDQRADPLPCPRGHVPAATRSRQGRGEENDPATLRRLVQPGIRQIDGPVHPAP
jgi:hypothetical protein